MKHFALCTTTYAQVVQDISSEMIKQMSDDGINVLHAICSKLWGSRKWPQD